MKKNLIISILILFLCACSLSPVPVCTRNGESFGKTSGIFGGRWYDYYERALSYMEGECYEAALADLKQAESRRSEDQRRARTYGMHFLDYFPHRETGLVHYLLGDYDAAKLELELSISQEQSAKALFYLDKTRKKIFEREKQAVSIPSLVVDLKPGTHEKPDEIRTKDDPILITGFADDKQYVAEIVLADKHVYLEQSGRHVEFKETLRLEQGRHEIDITARNLLGGRVEKKVIIHVDRSGPCVILEEFNPGIWVKGHLFDESGISSLKVNGKAVPVQNKEAPFAVPLTPDMNEVIFSASDTLGNKTVARIDADTWAGGSNKVVLAQNLLGLHRHKDTPSPAFWAMGKNRGLEKTPVEIILTGCPDQETTFAEKLYLDGHVTGKNRIKELSVNNTPVFMRPGRHIFFNYSMGLSPGENRIIISAKDELDNISHKEISITRKLPDVFQLKHRYGLAVYPFDNKEQITGKGLFQYFFLKNMVGRTRFRVMLREELEKILYEQNLKLSSIASSLSSNKGVGSDFRPAGAALMGIVYKTRNGIEAVVRLVDIKSSSILAIKDVYLDNLNQAALEGMAETLSEKLHREFPMLSGTIVEKAQDGFVADLGGGKPKMGWPIIIYREKKPGPNPATGRTLGSDKMRKKVSFEGKPHLC
ncbi:MAG: hypothetical protein GY864_03640 [Desulfobacterales bacterium]|nr:hypothetical protein [Desulfobacterales bacterium]